MEEGCHGIVLGREHGRLSILYRHGILPKNKISPPSAKASSSTKVLGFRYRNVERLSSLDAAIARSGQS